MNDQTSITLIYISVFNWGIFYRFVFLIYTYKCYIYVVNMIFSKWEFLFFNSSFLLGFFCITIYLLYTLFYLHPPLYTPPLQSPHCCPCLSVLFHFCLILPTLQPASPAQSCQPALYLWVCLYFVCKFSCSLDCTYE